MVTECFLLDYRICFYSVILYMGVIPTLFSGGQFRGGRSFLKLVNELTLFTPEKTYGIGILAIV